MPDVITVVNACQSWPEKLPYLIWATPRFIRRGTLLFKTPRSSFFTATMINWGYEMIVTGSMHLSHPGGFWYYSCGASWFLCPASRYKTPRFGWSRTCSIPLSLIRGEGNLKTWAQLFVLFAGSVLCGYYENFLTSEAITPSKPMIYDTVKELFESGFKIRIYDRYNNRRVPQPNRVRYLERIGALQLLNTSVYFTNSLKEFKNGGFIEENHGSNFWLESRRRTRLGWHVRDVQSWRVLSHRSTTVPRSGATLDGIWGISGWRSIWARSASAPTRTLRILDQSRVSTILSRH